MIDEFTKRKGNFEERNAAPVVLADGQEWFIPKPWIEIRPVFKKGRALYAYQVLTCGKKLDSLIEAIYQCENPNAEVWAVASLAAHLLNWHYELADDELDQLLAFRVGDPASLKWLGEVMAVATGQSGPKTLMRWRRLSLLAQGTPPPIMLLEDAVDAALFLSLCGRTVKSFRWAEESIAAFQISEVEAMEGLL